MSNRVEFVEPSTVAEGEARRQSLVDDISNITSQLSDKDKRHKDGSRYTNEEYHTWRKKALIALRARESVLRRLNEWLSSERRRLSLEQDKSPEAADAYARINDAYGLFLRLHEEDVDYTDEEWAVIDRLRAYTQRPEASAHA